MRILSPTRSRDTPPAEFRISAHRSFDFIPPIDMLLSSVPVAIRRCSSVTPSTSEMRSPREPSGFGRMSPSTVVRMMARSDRVMEASRAARISLSPNLSSSTETGSFSLMIGRTSCASSDLNAVQRIQMPLAGTQVLRGQQNLRGLESKFLRTPPRRRTSDGSARWPPAPAPRKAAGAVSSARELRIPVPTAPEETSST